uniref:Uncharacterized protein n=1 Tax=Lepeophtheirus salmonis TaxID=72036 RepID=A0A0K2THS1_LEPSM
MPHRALKLLDLVKHVIRYKILLNKLEKKRLLGLSQPRLFSVDLVFLMSPIHNKGPTEGHHYHC